MRLTRRKFLLSTAAVGAVAVIGGSKVEYGILEHPQYKYFIDSKLEFGYGPVTEIYANGILIWPDMKHEIIQT